MADVISGSDRRLLLLLQDEGGLTCAGLAGEIGGDEDLVRDALRRLYVRGMVRSRWVNGRLVYSSTYSGPVPEPRKT